MPAPLKKIVSARTELLLKEQPELFAKAADRLAHQIREVALRSLAELVVVGRLLADHESSCMVFGVKPFAGRSGLAIGTREPDSRPHLDKRAALRQFRRFLILDSHESNPLVILEDPHRADRNFCARIGLPDRPPVRGSPDKTDNHKWNKDDASEDEEGFFQTVFDPAGLSAIDHVLSTPWNGCHPLPLWYRIGAA